MGLLFSAARPEVEVTTGRLRGISYVTDAGTKYHAFMGIPYGRPPVGELRFKAPEPAERWTGIRDASAEGNPCHQGHQGTPTKGAMGLSFWLRAFRSIPMFVRRGLVFWRQNEDCLFLNVFVPVATFPADSGEEQALRPVLFMIHGGGYKLGDGNPDFMKPDLYLDNNIVVVTINYRLGPLGFLALGTLDVPGNAGMKDMVLALKWTNDNILAFGGDPRAITLYGGSSGASAAHQLSLSPLAAGLFRATMACSGSALCHWAMSHDGLHVARNLARELGIQADSPEELADALRAVTAAELMSAAGTMQPTTDSLSDENMFLPVVEPNHPGAFLSEDPADLVRKGQSTATPLLTGVYSMEGLVWTLFGVLEADEITRMNAHPHYCLPPDLRRALGEEQRDQCAREILDEYFAGEPITRENIMQFIELFGDAMFMTPHVALARLHSASGSSPLYQYRFDFSGRGNSFKAMAAAKLGTHPAQIPGAAHGDDMWYAFNASLLPVPALRPDSREMICRRRMVQLWTNFIETGNPTPVGEKLIPVQWTPCSRTSKPFLDIGTDLTIRQDDIFPRQAFWDRLYRKYMPSEYDDGTGSRSLDGAN